jgi:glycosyltransferase involved in cell wall biosynthesis
VKLDPYEDCEIREIRPDLPSISQFLSDTVPAHLLLLSEIHEYEYWSPPEEADVVVTFGTRAQHVIHHADQHRVHFFFTPARWLWDRYHGQWDQKHYMGHIRALDVTSTHRFDTAVAGSDLVRERVDSYYDIDPAVAYCPVDTFEFDHESDGGYYLVLGRINPQKRVKMIVEAFNELGLPLKVAGTASDDEADYARDCRRIAGDNVEFVGWVEGEQKRDLLANARALVFAAEREDFGMPPVEAMASGKPVVGVDEGYTRYQVDDGETGVLFEPTREALVEAVRECEKREWSPEAIQARSRQFDTRAVRNQWMRILRRTTER